MSGEAKKDSAELLAENLESQENGKTIGKSRKSEEQERRQREANRQARSRAEEEEERQREAERRRQREGGPLQLRPAMLPMECPHCGGPVEVQNEREGIYRCTYCQTVTRLWPPRPDAEPEPHRRRPSHNGGGFLVVAAVMALGFLCMLAYETLNVNPSPLPPSATIIGASPPKLILYAYKYNSAQTITEIGTDEVILLYWGFDPTTLFLGDTCSRCYTDRDNIQNNIKNMRYLPGIVPVHYKNGVGGVGITDSTVESSALLVSAVNTNQLSRGAAGKYAIYVTVTDSRPLSEQEYFWQVIELEEGENFSFYTVDVTSVVSTITRKDIKRIGSIYASHITHTDNTLSTEVVFNTFNGDLISNDSWGAAPIRVHVDFPDGMSWSGNIKFAGNQIPSGHIPGNTSDMWFDIPDLILGASIDIGYTGTYKAGTKISFFVEPYRADSGYSPVNYNSTSKWFGDYGMKGTLGKMVCSITDESSSSTLGEVLTKIFCIPLLFPIFVLLEGFS